MKRLAPVLLVAVAGVGCSPTGAADDGPPVDAPVERPPLTPGATTLAGWAEAGFLDGPREINLFHNPVNVTLDPGGLLFVADFDNGRIRAVDARGTATTVYADPTFSRPFALAVGRGALWVSTDNDPANGHNAMSGTIWKVDTTAHTASVVALRIGRPRGIAVLTDGRLAVTDYMHHVIELVEPATGVVSPLAGVWDAPGFADGLGAGARFDTPYAIVARADNTLVVADYGNHRLRVVALDGTVTTLADDFVHPQGLAITTAGDLYVSDSGSFEIRRLRAGTVETVAGNGTAGYLDDPDPMAAQFYGLEGLCVTADGSTAYVADGTRGEDVPFNRIRSVTLPH